MQDSKFIQWLDLTRENLYHRKEQRLASQNFAARKNREFIPNKKVVESFIAPPSFLLYLWASFPLLFVSTFQTNTIIAGVIATIINFFLIHQDTYHFVRYLMSGLVLLALVGLFHLNII
jgi:hypothetical protein